MPLSNDPLAAYKLADTLRLCVEARLTELGIEHPDRSCVITGSIAWDDCECGQLVVSIVRQFPASQWPAVAAQPAGNNAKCGPPYFVIEFEISLLRCAPTTGDDGKPPPCEALAAAAQVSVADAAAVRQGALCCLITLARELVNGRTEIHDYFVRDQPFTGSDGMCQGSSLNLLVALPNICPCG